MSEALISRFFSLRLKFRMVRYMVAKFSLSPYMAWIWLPRFIYGGQPGLTFDLLHAFCPYNRYLTLEIIFHSSLVFLRKQLVFNQTILFSKLNA